MPSSSPPSPLASHPSMGSLSFLPCFTEVQHNHIEEILRGLKPITCTLDPIPTTLHKSYIPILSPIITQAVNLSFQTCHVPPTLKVAVICPLLKKPTLDPEAPTNYRPISNLAFLSKVLEKAVASQLQEYLKLNDLFKKFQSGFCSAHSPAMLQVTNYLLMAADAGSPSLLILLDLTAAFDTVDHTILLKHLHNMIGLSDQALQWFQSYLSDRTKYIPLRECKSRSLPVTCGVPQGSFSSLTCSPLDVSSADMGFLSIVMLMTHNSTSRLLQTPLQSCHPSPPVSKRSRLG